MTLPVTSLDLETHLVAPGLLTPPIVIGSMCFPEPGTERLLTRGELVEWAPRIVRESKMIVGANIAYDLVDLVVHGYVRIEDVFAAYREGRVFDIQIAQALDAIAGGHLYKDPRTGAPLRGKGGKPGRYSLDTCVELTLGRTDAKKHDFWRMRYALLEDVPLADWPAEAKQYPLDDVRNTMDVFLRQVGQGGEPFENLHDMQRQCRAAFCLHLAAVWGLRTDPERVEEFEREATARAKARLDRFTGIFLRPDGSEQEALVKKAVAVAYGAEKPCPVCEGSGKVLGPPTKAGKRNPITCGGTHHKKAEGRQLGCDGTGLDLDAVPTLPRSDAGGVKTNRDTLMESGDEVLIAYAESSEKDYVDFLKAGVKWPVNPRHNVLVETGRTSSDLQQLPKKGGVREAFVFRTAGCSVDYAAVELCTWAQVKYRIFGRSRMRDVINETKDPGALHTALGARMLGVSMEEMQRRMKAKDKRARDFRQAAKAGNFGFPGGMGPVKFVLSKRDRKEGTTTTPDGAVTYPGIRFCILMGGAERCGLVKSTMWGNAKEPHPPVCVRCCECAKDLRDQWFEQWPEARDYFQYVNAQVEGLGEVFQIGSDRKRGGVNFTSAANGYFQALAADGAKEALGNVCEEGYCDESSPLYGWRPANFVHDEIVGDFWLIPEERWHDAAYRMSAIMQETMQRWCPDVVVSCAPALMRRLSKDAGDPVFDRSGRLIPFEDACRACAVPDDKSATHTRGWNCRAEEKAA